MATPRRRKMRSLYCIRVVAPDKSPRAFTQIWLCVVMRTCEIACNETDSVPARLNCGSRADRPDLRAGGACLRRIGGYDAVGCFDAWRHGMLSRRQELRARVLQGMSVRRRLCCRDRQHPDFRRKRILRSAVGRERCFCRQRDRSIVTRPGPTSETAPKLTCRRRRVRRNRPVSPGYRAAWRPPCLLTVLVHGTPTVGF